jgi:hypothetical protein
MRSRFLLAGAALALLAAPLATTQLSAQAAAAAKAAIGSWGVDLSGGDAAANGSMPPKSLPTAPPPAPSMTLTSARRSRSGT